jgi:lipopolysaccharide biosynthesis regulator YciM
MRLINVIFIAVIALALMWVGYAYIHNYAIMGNEVELLNFWNHANSIRVKVSTLLICVFLLGFILNLLYTATMEFRRLIRGFSASVATRAGKRLSNQLEEAREFLAHDLQRQARQVLEDLLTECSDHAAASLLMGEVLVKLGEYDQAVTHLDACCLTHPENVEFQYLLAEVLIAAHNIDRAVIILKRLAGDYPKYALRALRKLRGLHVENGCWDDAMDVQKRIVSRFADDMNPAEHSYSTGFLYQIGMDKVEADQFKEAAQIFQQVIKEDHSFVPAYLSLGRCMILQDQESQGIEIWLEGFRATGEGTMLQEVEDYFIQSGKPEDGLAVLRRVAAISEFAVTAKFFLGKMLYRLEILDDALDIFQEVRSQIVDSPILYFFIAKIHARRGRIEQAVNEYRQLLRNTGVLKMRFECSLCGHKTADYVDRCEPCGSWNSSRFLLKESESSELRLRSESGLWVGNI